MIQFGGKTFPSGRGGEGERERDKERKREEIGMKVCENKPQTLRESKTEKEREEEKEGS